MVTESPFGSVKLMTLSPDVQCLAINHQLASAKVSLYGGQVLSWQPVGQQDVFWLSENTLYQQGKAIRGGIPLCWPWFGGYKTAGNHGFVRNQQWQLDDVKVSEQGVNVILSWQGENMHSLWPTPAKLTQHLFFGASFKQRLVMHNLSDQVVQYTGALHSYFAVNHPKKTTVNGLNGALFDCKLSQEQQLTDNKENMVGPIDRIYYNKEPMEIVDAGNKRTIKVSAENTHQWVLWNPGQATAEQMADVHDSGENEFVCLEAANTQWQSIEANESVSMSQQIDLILTK